MVVTQKNIISKSSSSRRNSKNIHIPKDVYSSVVCVIVNGNDFDVRYPHLSHNTFSAHGTGFFIDLNGHILTCAHVVMDAHEILIEITSEGKKLYKAELLGICPNDKYDLALLRIKDYVNKTFCLLNNSNTSLSIQNGDDIFAVGYPLSRSSLKQSKGVISGGDRCNYQIDAAINGGNSGGPVFKYGYVIGVVSSCIPSAQGISYAVPIERFYCLGSIIYNKKKLIYMPDTIGFSYQSTYPEWLHHHNYPCKNSEIISKRLNVDKTKLCGVYISDIDIYSWFGRSGLRKGDVLCKIGKHDIDMYGDTDMHWLNMRMNISNLIYNLNLEEEIFIEYWSFKKKEKIISKLKIKEDRPAISYIYPAIEKIDYEIIAGMIVMPLTCEHRARHLLKYKNFNNIRQKAIIISQVLSPSYLSSFDTRNKHINNSINFSIISEVNDQKTKTLNQFRKAMVKPLGANYNKYIKLKIGDERDKIIVILPLNTIMNEELDLQKRVGYQLSNIFNTWQNEIK
tara:strand:+ start:124 stop:1653 length:1530 start_codon:yes stop_codon:yes gene_type:complete